MGKLTISEMERDIADDLIDYFANGDVQNKALVLALLEPLKRRNHQKSDSTIKADEETTADEKPKNHLLKEIEVKIDYVFSPIHLIVEKLLSLELQHIAEKVIIEARDLKKFTVKLFGNVNETKDSKEFEHDAFLRDHSLLPKLIFQPKVTLKKISQVYPNLPYPKYFNKKVNLMVILCAWLPFLSEYSREYPIGTGDSGVLVLILDEIFSKLFKSDQK